MATVEQIAEADGITEVGPSVDRFIGDDWVFSFQFNDSDGIAIDVSSYTWTAFLAAYPNSGKTALSGGNGSVDQSSAASGSVSVTVSDTLSSTVTPDKESVDSSLTISGVFYTRVYLVRTINGVSETQAIIPVRVIRP